MSLDVYLSIPGAIRKPGSGIWVRESGERRQISREEWDERFPYCEPCVLPSDVQDVIHADEVYSSNVTHNLNTMADKAGIYEACWRPEEIGITKAGQLVPLLRDGLAKLRSEPGHYSQFNPKNGWGNYEGFVQWVASYLDACEQHPEAEVSVSR